MRWRRVTEPSEERKDDRHELYRNEWWTRERRRPEIDDVVENSDEIVVFCDRDTGELAAFARALTDYTYETFVFDLLRSAERF